jgi:hypothetical protein
MLPTIIGIWAVVTVILIALSVHRSIFVMREEDTIFVSGGEHGKKSEYEMTVLRLKRLESVLKTFSFASGTLALLIAVLWIYERLHG